MHFLSVFHSARVDGYLFSHKAGNQKELEEELQPAIDAGHSSARMVDKAPLPDFDTGKAILFPRQVQPSCVRTCADWYCK